MWNRLVNTTAPGTGGYRLPFLEWEFNSWQPGDLTEVQSGVARPPVHMPWPRPACSMVGGDPAGVAGGYTVDNFTTYNEKVWYSGHGHAPYRITGTVKNSGGTAIPGASLKLYQTVGQGPAQGDGADGIRDAVVQETISAQTAEALNTGSYGFAVWDNVTLYYIRGENTDGTLVGTTVKTLVGS